jgi:diguanylate cyclase (GGDEF)-like protein
LLELVGAQPGAVFRVGPPGALLGRSEGAEVVFRDATVSAAHAQMHVEDGVVVVEDLSSRNGTFVNDKRVARTERLTDGDYVRLGSTLLKFSMMDDLEERVLRTSFELARHDPLTGLFNRRYFDERLRSEFLFARRHDTLVGLLFIDIDRFKRVNDTRGHATGDAVLKLVASSIQRMMRPEDVLSRHGGEEFTAILRATSLRNLQILGARVCQRVETLALEPAPHEFSVTVSIGVSQSGPDRRYDSPEALLAAADVALYAAKSAGGNRVVLA